MPVPSLKLPFNVIKPGAFNGAFPGVETQAISKKPVTPMINKVASDRVASLGRNGPAAPAPVPGPMAMTTAPAPEPAAMRMSPAPVNALSRGAPAGMGSMLGSPITPPNSLSRGASPGAASGLGGPIPVGRSANDPMRIAETARRSGNPALIMSLAGQQQDRQFQREMFGAQQQASAARDATNFEQGLQMFGAQQEAMDRRDATNFQQQQQMFQMQSQQRADESALEFQRRQEAERADRELSMNVTTKAIPGTDYVIPFAGAKAMSTIPVTKPEAPIPEGLVAQGALRDGVQYGPAKAAADAKAPSFTYEKDPNGSGKIIGAVYPEQDPQTGKWVLRRADLNGDGVVDPQEKLRAYEAAKAAALAAPAAAQGTAKTVKTKAGNSYTFK